MLLIIPLEQLTAASLSDLPEEAQAGGWGERREEKVTSEKAAPFGGVRFKLQKTPLHLIAEYNSDDYDREVAPILWINPPLGTLGLNGDLITLLL